MKKKKIFIDCGANQGQSVENFKKYWKDWNEYDIHTFEANPKLIKFFDKYQNTNNITFHHKVVWVEDGDVDFYLGKYDGSSVCKHKKTGNLSKTPIKLPSIDLNNFIKTNFSINDYIILKIDIEGGEYDLIPHLLDNNTFKYINELYIEFHNRKVGKSVEDDKFLLEQINKFDVKIIDDPWTGLNFIGR